MRPTTGGWVVGEDFFDRESELGILDGKVRDGNHILLIGQRRVGTTSVARELGRRLEASGWISLFVDVKSADSEEDVIAGIARSMHHVHPLKDRVVEIVRDWFKDQVDEFGAIDFQVKFRAGCFESLARHQNLSVENGVASAVYEALGIGIPHHVQAFFARLKDYATMRPRSRLTITDVDEVYRYELLGASDQYDLTHYAARLSEALAGPEHSIAMEILAETATQGACTRESRRSLAALYAALVDKVEERILSTVALLEHDGYIENDHGEYSMPSRLLKDWWSARFQHHYTPLRQRCQSICSWN